MWARTLYYTMKPLIPRKVQIGLRRMLVQRQLKRHGDVWPVDERASKPPDLWSGWPGGKHFALVLAHDVDTVRGHERTRELMAFEQRLGFRSAFNFVPERYAVSPELRRDIVERGFEVAVHGLNHDGTLFQSRKKFQEQALRINHYLKEWNSVGFVSPSMHHNLEWTHDLNIEYDISTFDTDPFEPQPDGVATIFPFFVQGRDGRPGYIELPYTLPQDFTLFALMQEKNIDIWKKKLDWIAGKGGMALLISHPDYMNGSSGRIIEEYPMDRYKEFLEYVKDRYAGQYWNALPKEMSLFWRENMVKAGGKTASDRSAPGLFPHSRLVPSGETGRADLQGYSKPAFCGAQPGRGNIG